uniref:Ubiquitin-like protease family profile domain-containing protein n=1 Tax=Wuchereria bancrofti TaxID=6293 RepID=A0AAF5Q5C8_WUCBA
MTKEDKTSNDEGDVEMSSSVSNVGTCQSLPSQIFTCVSRTDDNSSITSLTSLTQEDFQKEYENVKQKAEIRITGGTKKSSISRTKRRVHNEEINYGEQVADDLINEYCDKLNRALRNRFDGMLAIQYIALDPQNLDRLITGRKPVLQILLDQKREHYVLVERTLVDDTVIVFDSLATSRKKAKDALNRGLSEQIFNMFNHLSPIGGVKVRYEIAIEKQDDMWSCGLRTVAYITCRAFDNDPQCYIFNMEKVFKYFCNLLNEQNPDVEEFRYAFERFGKWMHHHSKAEEAIFKIAKRNDHQFHIENSDMQETNMLSENSTTSSERQRGLKKNNKRDE